MKFKAGDKVRIVFPKCPSISLVAWLSIMDKYIGEIHHIEKVFPTYCAYTLKGLPYRFDENWLEPVNDQKILITTDGKETKARLYDGKKVVKESVAKCSPKDEFDFETGAKIAFERLVGKEEKPKQKFKIGDYAIGNKKANKYAYITEGWLGVVSGFDGDRINVKNGNDTYWVYPDDFDLVDVTIKRVED